MAYLEKDFQTDFNTWLKYRFKQTGAYELKVTKGGSLPFKRLAPHQELALRKAKSSMVVYKIPDVGYDQKPFDCFALCGVPSFVVVMYQTLEQRKEFYMIDIDTWVKEKETSGKPSVSRERAGEIGTLCVLK